VRNEYLIVGALAALGLYMISQNQKKDNLVASPTPAADTTRLFTAPFKADYSLLPNSIKSDVQFKEKPLEITSGFYGPSFEDLMK